MIPTAGEKKNISKKNELDNEKTALDVPGAESDNADENIGEEDEENNYSIGGDDHNDVEKEPKE